MLKITTIAAATLVAVSASAFADQTNASTMTFGNHMYVGVQAGYGKVNFKNVSKNKGFVYGLNAGDMFTKNFGVEAGVHKYNNVKAGGVTEKDNYQVHIAAVASMPVASNLSVFGKIGPAWVHGKAQSQSESKITGFAALGTAYNVSQNIQVTADVEGTAKHSELPAMYSANAGVNYIF